MVRKTTKPDTNTVTLQPAKVAQVTAKVDVTAPETKVVVGAVPVVGGALVKKPEFLDRAVTRTDVKKRDAKPAIEAALQVLADALMAGEELNLPPMGKLKVVKSRDIGDGAHVLTLKLRTMKDGAGQGNGNVPGDASPEEDV